MLEVHMIMSYLFIVCTYYKKSDNVVTFFLPWEMLANARHWFRNYF